tara:strand:+ start:8045 stop:8218 length:174 start_codon:yes stop_codon:yes gene_type:complete
MGRWQWSVVVIIEVSGNKKARFMGLSGHSWSLVDNELVEAAGIEPASVSPLPKALHA